MAAWCDYACRPGRTRAKTGKRRADLMDSTPIAAAAALATSVSVVSVELPLLRRLAVIDHPCERSSHATPTLRGGGVGVVLAVVVGLALLDDTRAATGAVLLAGLGLGAVGLVEDVHGSRVATRMAAHLLIAVTLVTLVGKPGLMIPLEIVAVVAFVNAFNFMDGVNGISGVSAGVIAGSYAVLNAGREDGVRGPALVVALAAVGFLPWNAVRARLFLGDVGS